MSYTWTEITQGIGSAPAWTLAGRRDGPVSSGGEAAAALFQAGMSAINDASVNHAINNRKPQAERNVAQIMEGHRNGGVLVVAGIEVRQVGEMRSSIFHYLSAGVQVFSRPEHAISVWRRSPRLEPAQTMQHRFFWVTRA